MVAFGNPVISITSSSTRIFCPTYKPLCLTSESTVRVVWELLQAALSCTSCTFKNSALSCTTFPEESVGFVTLKPFASTSVPSIKQYPPGFIDPTFSFQINAYGLFPVFVMVLAST